MYFAKNILNQFMRARYPNEFSICGYNYFLKCTLGKQIESVHDNMTSCNCSICGHNFILKSNHNNSLKYTLKKKNIFNQFVTRT